MTKLKIANADLVWMLHEELRAFGNFPLHGISIAIVSTAMEVGER